MTTERPLIMTPENAQKSHDGVKTNTRRLNGLERINLRPNRWEGSHFTSVEGKMCAVFYGIGKHRQMRQAFFPYGNVLDRLWIREAWAPAVNHGGYIYKGTVEPGDFSAIKFRSARYMPRIACRTVVEITKVCIQRVQEISREDAIAEGMPTQSPMTRFAELWESINGKGAWERNDWVWSIHYKKVAA